MRILWKLQRIQTFSTNGVSSIGCKCRKNDEWIELIKWEKLYRNSHENLKLWWMEFIIRSHFSSSVDLIEKLNFPFNLKTVMNIAVSYKYSFDCQYSNPLIKCIKWWEKKICRSKKRNTKDLVDVVLPFQFHLKCIAFFDLHFMYSLLSPIYWKIEIHSHFVAARYKEEYFHILFNRFWGF